MPAKTGEETRFWAGDNLPWVQAGRKSKFQMTFCKNNFSVLKENLLFLCMVASKPHVNY